MTFIEFCYVFAERQLQCTSSTRSYKSGNIILTFWQIICHVGKCGTVRVGGHVAGVVRGAGAETRDRSDFTSESVLRQKEACREAVEKCRAGRGAHIQWGRDNGIIQDYNKTPYYVIRITTLKQLTLLLIIITTIFIKITYSSSQSEDIIIDQI